MKKLGFKVLCMVLVMALLSPNVFAATPAPEVPLADAATVERVKQEIAVGQITDMEDLFLVAYQHLGADLEEEGMTAYINEDGTLGFTQIIERNDSDASVYSLDSSGEINFTVSTLALIDDEGAVITSNTYSPPPDQVSGSMNGTSVGVLHTVYYNGRVTPGYNDDEATEIKEIRLSYMVTSISGASGTHYVTSLLQEYWHKNDLGNIDVYDSKTTTNIVSGSYSFTPSNRAWYVDYGRIGSLGTQVTIHISGISNPIYLITSNSTFTTLD